MSEEQPRPADAQACVNFRRNLRAYIKHRPELTQRKLAERINGAQAYVNLVLKGRYAPGLDYVQRVADGLGIPIEDLISNEKRFSVYLLDG